MKNEYGASLDQNGYAPSVLCATNCCSLCFRTDRHLQRHEVFHGADRQKSKRYGLWINVCPECHEKIHQRGGGTDLRLKEWAQRNAMIVYGWTKDDFRRRFRKNYV